MTECCSPPRLNCASWRCRQNTYLYSTPPPHNNKRGSVNASFADEVRSNTCHPCLQTIPVAESRTDPPDRPRSKTICTLNSSQHDTAHDTANGIVLRNNHAFARMASWGCCFVRLSNYGFLWPKRHGISCTRSCGQKLRYSRAIKLEVADPRKAVHKIYLGQIFGMRQSLSRLHPVHFVFDKGCWRCLIVFGLKQVVNKPSLTIVVRMRVPKFREEKTCTTCCTQNRPAIILSNTRSTSFGMDSPIEEGLHLGRVRQVVLMATDPTVSAQGPTSYHAEMKNAVHNAVLVGNAANGVRKRTEGYIAHLRKPHSQHTDTLSPTRTAL